MEYQSQATYSCGTEQLLGLTASSDRPIATHRVAWLVCASVCSQVSDVDRCRLPLGSCKMRGAEWGD